MKKKISQNSLFNSLDKVIPEIEDVRDTSLTFYSIRDAVFTAFSGFFTHASSLNHHCKTLAGKSGRHNYAKLFGLESVPCPNQIRNILDAIPTEHFADVQDDIIFKTQGSTLLREFYSTVVGAYLVGVDGVEFFRSTSINCSNCCTAHHQDDTISYYHRMLLAGLIHPSQDIFLPLHQEFIVKQDGSTKEDCERVAVKRWWKDFRSRHPQLKVCLLGDDAFSTEPLLKMVLESKQDAILSCKPGSHKYLYEWIELLRQGNQLPKVEKRVRQGKYFYRHVYEYANDVPLKDGEKALRVSFASVTIYNQNNEKINTFAYVTTIDVTKENCVEIVNIGRRRWKNENEGNNVLKNRQYHLEHNFGHGKKNLAHNFVLLNLLAFMMHVILLLAQQEGYARLRQEMETLKAAIEAMRAVLRVIRVNNWDDFYRYACEGIDSS